MDGRKTRWQECQNCDGPLGHFAWEGLAFLGETKVGRQRKTQILNVPVMQAFIHLILMTTLLPTPTLGIVTPFGGKETEA